MENHWINCSYMQLLFNSPHSATVLGYSWWLRNFVRYHQLVIIRLLTQLENENLFQVFSPNYSVNIYTNVCNFYCFQQKLFFNWLNSILGTFDTIWAWFTVGCLVESPKFRLERTLTLPHKFQNKYEFSFTSLVVLLKCRHLRKWNHWKPSSKLYHRSTAVNPHVSDT